MHDTRTAAPTVQSPALLRGAGACLYRADGMRLIDFASGGLAPFGHGLAGGDYALAVPDVLLEAARAPLVERLTAVSFADHVDAMTSADEAAERALEAIWAYQAAMKRPKRQRIVTFENGVHGTTPLLRLAVGDNTVPRGFDPLGDRFDRAVFNDLASVRAAIGPQTAGILVEPMQRAGTFEPPQNGFLMGLRDLADEYDLVLAYDETQCGFGRLATLWAHEWSGAAPDVMILGNNLAGGLPFGALLTTAKIAKATGPRAQTAHPLSLVNALDALSRLLAPGFLQTVAARSWALEDRLYWLARNNPHAIETRCGMGLCQALKLRVPARALHEHLMGQGLVTAMGAGDVLALIPALTVSEAEVEEAIAVLAAALAP